MASPVAQPAPTLGLRGLLLQLALCAAVLGLIDGKVRSFAEGRFIPFARVSSAAKAGDGCLVLLGGSDMDSAMVDSIVGPGLVGSGAVPCVARLTIGNTSQDHRYMAFREYLQSGRKPAALLIGFKGYEIANETPLRPGYYLGNGASVYGWGRATDLVTYFPEPSFAAVDNGVRFLLWRATGLGAYRQALWERVQATERQLGLRQQVELNAFGDKDEFVAVGELIRRELLENQRTATGRYALTRFNARLVELGAQSGVRSIHFVRLPSPSETERVYFKDDASERKFSDFMRATAARHGGLYIDLSKLPGMSDEHFIDGLHYTRSASELVSRAVVAPLAARR